MKPHYCICLTFLAIPLTNRAAVRYVDLQNPAPTPPYLSWSTAADNIQDAIDAAEAGDEIVVAEGVYATGGRAMSGSPTNRVVVDKAVVVRSVSGPANAIIRGYQVLGATNGEAAIRCVYMTNAAVLSGFTLTGGATLQDFGTNADWLGLSGGGVWCASTEPIVTNCILTGNAAARDGGGGFRGTLRDCLISSNSAGFWNGGGGGSSSSILINCQIIANRSLAGSGGGVVAGELSNCTLLGNVAYDGGGGASGGRLLDCLVVTNTALTWGGGLFGCFATNTVIMGNSGRIGGGGASDAGLYNCLVISNRSEFGSGGTSVAWAKNCTVVGNTSERGVGGLAAGYATNCISYFNYGTAGISNYYSGGYLDHCCTIPLPPRQIASVTNEPLFVDAAAGNFRLQSDSPCIDAGINAAALTSTDLDGNPRIVGGVVDIGAYEFQGASAAPKVSISDSGATITLTWQSLAGRTYYVECSTNLVGSRCFFRIASNIPSGGDTTSWTHTNAVGIPLRFYRVGVE